MSSNFCIAQFKSKPGLFNQLESEIKKLVPLSRSEAGCLSYTMNYSSDCDRTIIILEHFIDKDSYTSHSQQWYLKDFAKCLPDLIEDASIYLCGEVNKL